MIGAISAVETFKSFLTISFDLTMIKNEFLIVNIGRSGTKHVHT